MVSFFIKKKKSQQNSCWDHDLISRRCGEPLVSYNYLFIGLRGGVLVLDVEKELTIAQMFCKLHSFFQTERVLVYITMTYNMGNQI